MATFPRFMIAATHSGAGKTSWTLGILGALAGRGLRVQPFKAGPDYIDPGLHTLVAGRVSRNLDTRLIPGPRIRTLFRHNAADADISGTSSSAAATALGFLKYRRHSGIAGFLLNRAGSEKHYLLAKEPVEAATGLPVFGYLPADSSLHLPERHLGLVAGGENPGFVQIVRHLSEAVGRYVDLDSMLSIARAAREPKPGSRESFLTAPFPFRTVARIAVARDESVSFHYEDNLDILRRCGAELAFFSPLRDGSLPDGCDGLYLGGGYPELYAQALESNIVMRACIRDFVDTGRPVFAECGGYMYLMDSILGKDGASHGMAGVLRGRAVMGTGKAALGYHDAVFRRDCPLGRAGDRLSGHCFHWSHFEPDPGSKERPAAGSAVGQAVDPEAGPAFGSALLVSKNGNDPFPDGHATDSIFASYLHIHFAGNPRLAANFVRACASRPMR